MRLPESQRLAVFPPKTFFVAGSGAVVAGTGRVLQRADGDTVRQNRNMNSKQGDAKQWRQHRLHRCTTGFWSGALKRAKASVAASFPLDVKAGDSILFGKYSGTEIKIDGEELLIMREEEVLGILKK
jgi:hypothetical protein